MDSDKHWIPGSVSHCCFPLNLSAAYPLVGAKGHDEGPQEGKSGRTEDSIGIGRCANRNRIAERLQVEL